MKKYIQQRRKWCVAKRSFCTICFVIIPLFLTSSCKATFREPIIIWTNQSEIATYVELFNLTSESAKAVVIYKENPAASFPLQKNDSAPDIVIGSWLKVADIRDTFLPLDYFFDDQLINKTQFYPQLLDFGKTGNQQYLLPVSFNLSAVVFSQSNSNSIPENHMLNPDQIRDTSTLFNQAENEKYTAMGFAPSWSPLFLYEVAKLNNADFSEKKGGETSFTWDDDALNNTIAYFREWTTGINLSTTTETEYQFKYLANPTLRNILNNNSLFAFMPSNELFITPSEYLDGIYFRWIQQDNKIVIHDDMLTAGLYKHSKNLTAAEQFLIWFMNEQNQETILNWYDSMNLYTETFGIAGGFSSIRSVNERFFPIHYPALWGNIPSSDSLVPPNRLPPDWDRIKDAIILPYLIDATNTDNSEPVHTIQERLTDWYRFSQ